MLEWGDCLKIYKTSLLGLKLLIKLSKKFFEKREGGEEDQDLSFRELEEIVKEFVTFIGKEIISYQT
ncbi:MAG: hypothetical protein ACPLKX_07275 [Dictyoglomaceae bacterium]